MYSSMKGRCCFGENATGPRCWQIYSPLAPKSRFMVYSLNSTNRHKPLLVSGTRQMFQAVEDLATNSFEPMKIDGPDISAARSRHAMPPVVDTDVQFFPNSAELGDGRVHFFCFCRAKVLEALMQGLINQPPARTKIGPGSALARFGPQKHVPVWLRLGCRSKAIPCRCEKKQGIGSFLPAPSPLDSSADRART